MTRAARIAMLLLLCAAPATRAQVVSPGELSSGHARLEGIANCTRCHKAGAQLAAELCLDCHAELKPRIAAKRGFHGRLADARRNACQSCHHEHQGRDVPLVDWEGPMTRFDHGRTGFVLKGAHAKVACRTCHENRRIADPQVKALVGKTSRKTFLGLPTACATCHFDEHRGQVGQACESCHTEASWKPAPGFSHGKTAFALEGKHAAVACAKCHPSERDEASTPRFPAPRDARYLRFKEIPHARCTDCHSDPHEGKLGPACESCHSPSGWRAMKSKVKDSGFHEKTRFPLRGAHVTVACRSCHGPSPGRAAKFRGLRHDACADCHVDAHLGQLGKRGERSAACERCHTVEAFLPARFELEQHAETKFPLEGAHGAVACRLCHPQDPRLHERAAALERSLRRKKVTAHLSRILLRPRATVEDCKRCHDDPHAGQLTDGERTCKSCHTTDAFRPASFDHARSRFPLTGRHAAAACASCHRETRLAGRQVVLYRPLPVSCAGCHTDVHAGQFAPRNPAGSLGETACERCHTTEKFQPSLFSHGDRRFTAFALEGRHAVLACAGCHPMLSVAPGRTVRRYKPIPTTCAGCHVDVHRGAFRGFEP